MVTQVDYRTRVDEKQRVTHIKDTPIVPEHEYVVAIPRNLLAGFCNIQPLVLWAEANTSRLPDEGIFSPAFQLVLTHYAQEIWEGLGDFEEMDANDDGIISASELRRAVHNRIGKEPSEQLMTCLITALDEDGDGEISHEEFDRFHRRARVRRRRGDTSS